MHDDNLGPPVDVGEYMGPMLEGEPLHPGNCTDSTHGCRRCNQAISALTDEQLRQIGWDPEDMESFCDWCKKKVHRRDLRGVKPYDEGGAIYYEVCTDCRAKYDAALERELEEERMRDPLYDPSHYPYDD